MGVVNLSTDSWYRESVCLTAEAAIQRGKILTAQGADIIDIGAESTLAHAARVKDAAQKSKLIPVDQKIAHRKNPRLGRNLFAKSRARGTRSRGEYFEPDRNCRLKRNLSEWSAAHDAAVIICFVQGKNVREVGDFDLSADPVPMMKGYFSRQD
jgi:dihydropteroate synthase